MFGRTICIKIKLCLLSLCYIKLLSNNLETSNYSTFIKAAMSVGSMYNSPLQQEYPFCHTNLRVGSMTCIHSTPSQEFVSIL